MTTIDTTTVSAAAALAAVAGYVTTRARRIAIRVPRHDKPVRHGRFA